MHLLIGVHSTSDPLLGPVDDPVFPVFSLLGVGLETEHIRSGMSLRDGKANELLCRKNLGKHFLFEFLRAKVHDGWEADDQATNNTYVMLFSVREARILQPPTVTVTTVATTDELLRCNQFVE